MATEREMETMTELRDEIDTDLTDLSKKLARLNERVRQRKEVDRRVRIWELKRELRRWAPWIAAAVAGLIVGVLLWK